MKKTTFWVSMLLITLLSLGVSYVTQAQSKAVKYEVVDRSLNSYDKTINKASDGISTVYNDVKSLSPKVGQALESIGKELKVGVENVWNVLVRQQLVWSIVFLILTLTSITNWIIFYSRNFKKADPKNCVKGKQDIWGEIDNPEFDQKYYDRYKSYTDSSSYKSEVSDIRFKKTIRAKVGECDILVPIPEIDRGLGWFRYIHFIICIILSIYSFIHFSDMLTGFINPEFGAMKTIAEIASKIK